MVGRGMSMLEDGWEGGKSGERAPEKGRCKEEEKLCLVLSYPRPTRLSGALSHVKMLGGAVSLWSGGGTRRAPPSVPTT